jgi:hypothetical protein
MAAAGCILGALSLAINGLGFRDHEAVAYRSQRAICAVISYSEDTLKQYPPEARADNPQAAMRFEKLIRDMKATGVQCPPPKPGP